jgi:hypothetical protein
MEKSDPGSGINIPDPQHWYLVFTYARNWMRSVEYKVSCFEDEKMYSPV